ncbi:MAG: B12-binding domain-containing radical SAM protein, partial [Desulfobacterales bacterium]|nr:B12-binding domain-containing radical SAM protein [Desulfobacterales bacterium]
MRYEGPIYRPPSEADSLLIQATIGCPHNRCTFCMVYKDGPRYRVRPVDDIKEDMLEAKKIYGPHVRTMFLPAGNTIAMKTEDLAEVCSFAKMTFPTIDRITVNGSSQFIHKKGPIQLERLAKAGLGRIHVGIESGDDVVLRRIRKGTHARQQIEAGRWVMAAGIELSLYVILGIGGRERTREHAEETARVINEIAPDFLRLRTFVPKINTPLLEDVQAGRFEMLTPHGVLEETKALLEGLTIATTLTSDHYTNYINLYGRL